MEEQKPYNLDTERKNLADYVRLQGGGFAEHLGKVVDYLHQDLPYLRMLEHARDLKDSNKRDNNYNIESAISELTEKELPIVRGYLLTVAAYIGGNIKFGAVKKAARKLSYSKPIPDTIYAPPGSFPEDLARAREEV